MEIRVLGPLELADDAGPIALPAFKHRQLLGALVTPPGTMRSADELIDALWGEMPPASAGKLLQAYVSHLRKVLPSPARIKTGVAAYLLELPDASLDSVRFERLVEEGRAAGRAGNPALASSLLRRGLALWRGDAFADLADEPYVRPEAERLAELRLAAIEERIGAELELGRHAGVLPELVALAGAHPLRERLQADLMVALYRLGRQAEALAVYSATRRHLRDELGLDADPDLDDLQLRILRQDPRLLVPRREVERGAALPAPPNDLLGRREQLDELHALLLRDGVRLIVLTGAGGSGKTRLAIEAAREAAAWFANGAAFVDLSPVLDPGLVLTAISHAVGAGAQAGRSVEALSDALASRELLLVVDNAEHLATAAPLYADLLARAPRLTLLITSRAVLHLSGEHVYPVEPLRDEAAAALFVARAQAARYGFAATTADDVAIRQVCRRLDGLPLAIELAASRGRTLAVAELLEQLEPTLPLLNDGPHDVPARQATLRATLDWSHSLLDDEERMAFRRLSVFRGGWTLEAADAVCGVRHALLGALVDHSLVTRIELDGRSRYGMLETVREYAAEQLASSTADRQVNCRHAEYVLELSLSANLGIESEGEQRYDIVAAEADNLRAALRWTIAAGAIELGLRIAVATQDFWVTGHEFEGIRWLEALMAAATEVPRKLRADARLVHAGILHDTGSYERAGALYRRSLADYEAIGDTSGCAHALDRLTSTAVVQGDVAAARALAVRSLDLQRRAGNRRGEANALGMQARVEWEAGRRPLAFRLARRSLEAAGAAGHRWWEVVMLGWLAEWSLAAGARVDAEAFCRKGLTLAVRLGDRQSIVFALAVLARIEAESGATALAGLLWGAVEAEEQRGAVGQWEVQRDMYAEPVLAHRDEAFEEAREAARLLPLDDVVERVMRRR